MVDRLERNSYLVLHYSQSIRLNLEVSRALQDVLGQNMQLVVVTVQRDIQTKRLTAQTVSETREISVVRELRKGVRDQIREQPESQTMSS